jgi:hypothetical protein
MEADPHAERTKKDLFAIGLRSLVEQDDKKDEENGTESNKAKPILSPFRSKIIPALKPSKDFSTQNIQNITEQFLCTECCSHRIVRIGGGVHTAGSLASNNIGNIMRQSVDQMLNKSAILDVIIVYAGAHPEILLPPGDAQNKNNFKLNSFVCLCQNKSLLCETVYPTNPASASLPYKFPNANEKEQLYEMMRVGGGMVLRNQRIIQMKTLVPDQNRPPPGPKSFPISNSTARNATQ